MKVRRLVALCTAMFLSLQMAELPASAAGRFSDVPAGSPFYESVTYLAECGITAGTGGHSFSPERPITVREWAALLFRAFDGSTLSCDSPKERSELSIQRCYQNGWLGVSAAISPDGTLCRGELLLSAFHAAGLPVYNASLYGYEEAGCLRRKTRYALERNLDCAPKRPPFGVQLLPSLNRKIFQSTIYGRKTAAGCSIRAVLWHKSVGSTDSRSGRACNKLRMRLAIMIYLGR
jgi:hypothetical protein